MIGARPLAIPYDGGGSMVGTSPAPVKREPSLICDVAPGTSSSFSSTDGGGGGGGEDNKIDGGLEFTGDMREKLSREEYLLRAIEDVNARSGGVSKDIDCEAVAVAAGGLIDGVNLGEMTAVVPAW